MGRSGARARTSGGTLSGEGLLKTQYLSLNLTLFQFLQTGYFEKDLLSYCANRLADYSCIYWLNPNVDEDTETVELHTAAYHTGNVGWSKWINTPILFANSQIKRRTNIRLDIYIQTKRYDWIFSQLFKLCSAEIKTSLWWMVSHGVSEYHD